MFINELFDKIAKWDYTEKTGEQIKAEFEVGENHYIVTLFQSPGDVVWGVEFTVGAFNNSGYWLSHNVELTGTGNEFQVFATVLDIIKKTADEVDIQKLKFSADKFETDSREKLYTRMVSILSKGWDVNIRNTKYGTEYILTKKGYKHD